MAEINQSMYEKPSIYVKFPQSINQLTTSYSLFLKYEYEFVLFYYYLF